MATVAMIAQTRQISREISVICGLKMRVDSQQVRNSLCQVKHIDIYKDRS